MKKKFECEIDCANCAAEVQDAISKINGVQSAKVNFMMQKFTLEAEDERFDEILKEAIRIGKTIEPDFKVMGVEKCRQKADEIKGLFWSRKN